MPLRVVRRKDTGTLQIAGTVRGQRVRRRAQTNNRRLAQEEALDLERQIIRGAAYVAPVEPSAESKPKSFAEATVSYLKAERRPVGDQRRIYRILEAIGRDIALSEMNQEQVDTIRDKVLKPNPSPATVRRGIITPIRAIMMHAHRRGWCPRPVFEIPRQPAAREIYLLPAEAERLVAAAAAHLKPLFVMLLCTGARVAEALELNWREVDLPGRRVILWTKGKPRRRRVAMLPPRVVAALGALPYREGRVFRWETRRGSGDYADTGRQYGGQIKTGWAGALRRCGLDADLTPHDLRHTWASWHYAIHKDLLKLKVDGQWSSVTLVERYAHLMPDGLEEEIHAFWGMA